MVSVNQYHGGKQKSQVFRKSWYQKKQQQLALNEVSGQQSDPQHGIWPSQKTILSDILLSDTAATVKTVKISSLYSGKSTRGCSGYELLIFINLKIRKSRIFI